MLTTTIFTIIQLCLLLYSLVELDNLDNRENVRNCLITICVFLSLVVLTCIYIKKYYNIHFIFFILSIFLIVEFEKQNINVVKNILITLITLSFIVLLTSIFLLYQKPLIQKPLIQEPLIQEPIEFIRDDIFITR